MNKLGAVTFWSVDAFLTLSGTSVYKNLTPELISRLSAFVDSYILFDRVCLPQRYSKKLNSLGGSEVFDFIPSTDLMHSDDLANGITFDINFALFALPKISEQEDFWTIQHDPSIAIEDYKRIIPDPKIKMMSLMRIWLSSAMNEISDKYKATILIPNSLYEINELQNKPTGDVDYLNKIFKQFSEQWSGRLIATSRNYKDPYIDTIKNYPPFLASLLDRASSRDELQKVLKEMRCEYKELREIRAKFTSAIESADSIGEKRDIIQSWDDSWNSILKSDFKRTGFCSKKVSSNEIVKMVFDPLNYLEAFKFLTQKTLDFKETSQRYKQFKVFYQIAKDTDGVYFSNNDLYKKFGIGSVVAC